MMWFFAILIVLLLGAVAFAASGRGGALSDAYDDRPDALVPGSGPLTSADLKRVRFSIALRGYRMSEVDALLDRLAAEREPVDVPVETKGRGTKARAAKDSAKDDGPEDAEDRG